MTMLIVESQARMRRMLRELLLSEHPDSEMLEADNAGAALELALRHRPSLVLMDAKLPDTDGIALIGRLTALLPGTSVIVVSPGPDRTCVRRALAAGAFAFVARERRYRELLPTIASALLPKQAVAKASDPIEAGCAY